MSRQPIVRSPDLQHLVDDGFTVRIVAGLLVVEDVPFVDSSCKVHVDGKLVMPLELAGEVVRSPGDHTASFVGGIPCTAAGTELTKIINGHGPTHLGDGIIAACSFSMKPVHNDGRYVDFYDKVTKYVAAITGHATAIDATARATVFRPIQADDDDGSPFNYVDTASSRAGIGAVNDKLRGEQVAIVGLGGTGEYILDLVAKTHVHAIHIFDGDDFQTHNAFRAPGAPSLEQLNAAPLKVDHFSELYGNMRTGIVVHPFEIDESNVNLLREMTFVFVAIDSAPAKRPIIESLLRFSIPFVDVGMGVELVDGHLTGMLRTTIVTPDKFDHATARIPFEDTAGPDDYPSNIQIAELNARNAAEAVIAWKRYRGFYADLDAGHSSTFTIATNHTVNSDHRVAFDPEGD